MRWYWVVGIVGVLLGAALYLSGNPLPFRSTGPTDSAEADPWADPWADPSAAPFPAEPPSAPEPMARVPDAGRSDAGAVATPRDAPHPEQRKPIVREVFEREPRDGTAAQAEARLRAMFADQDKASHIFRGVQCTRSVCRLELRWSPELAPGYEAGLLRVVEEFSKEITFEPDGKLEEELMPVPMLIYVPRPGHTVESMRSH